MSTLAPSFMLAEDPEKFSPFSFCKEGSTVTFEQASVNRQAVRSRSSIWRRVGNPPFVHDKAWSTVKFFPQAQWDGIGPGGSSLTGEQGCRGNHFCEGRTRDPGWVGHSAS